MIVWRHSYLVIRKLRLFHFQYYFHYFPKEHARFYSLMYTFWQNDVCPRTHNTWRLLFSHNLYRIVLYLHTYNKQRLTLLLVVCLPVSSGTMVWSLDCVVLVAPPGLNNVVLFNVEPGWFRHCWPQQQIGYLHVPPYVSNASRLVRTCVKLF